MKYDELVKKNVDNVTSFERGDVLVREMCQLIDNIMGYRYVAENGKGTQLEDNKNKVKKSIILVKSDLDVYIEQLGITEDVSDGARKRLKRLIK